MMAHAEFLYMLGLAESDYGLFGIGVPAEMQSGMTCVNGIAAVWPSSHILTQQKGSVKPRYTDAHSARSVAPSWWLLRYARYSRSKLVWIVLVNLDAT